MDSKNLQQNNEINWVEKKFDDLLPAELYAFLRLRTEVFVVEQNCVFQDMDNEDDKCIHLLGYVGNKLAAYTRLVPPNIFYPEPSIGRVVTSPAYRGSGIGRILMQKSIERVEKLFGKQSINIGGQLYLKKFYESLGFSQVSEIYLEDGIEHIYMIRNASIE